jgi:hypothetical protein
MPLVRYDPFKPKTVKDKANRTEKALAKDLGGRRQPMSGAFAGLKGDIILSDFLIDSKETEADSISLTKEMLKKITREAHGSNRIPMIIVTFRNKTEGVDNKWVIVPYSETK